VLGGGVGCGELLDQGAEGGAVLSFQEAFQSQSPVAAFPPPQFPRCGGGFGLLSGRGTVLVQVRQEVSSDLGQRRGGERVGVAG
jgi:hypothetical protein